MNRKLRVIALAGACGFAAHALHAESSRLTGTVTGKPRVESKSGAGGGAYGSRELAYAAKFDYKHLKNVVVYAEPKGEASAAPATGAPRVFVFSGLRDDFAVKPDFIAVAPGTEVVFRNDTSNPLNVYAKGGFAPIILAVAGRKSRSVHPPTTGLFNIGCLEGPSAKARLFVASPYFAVADAAGKYAIDLPPGEYTVTAWHERLPPQSETVTIGSDQTRTLNFVLSVSGLPQVN